MRKIKRFVHVAKKQTIRASKSRYVHNRKIWAITAAAVLAIIFWALPTFAAKAPGQLGYAIKRSEESLASNLAPLSSWRESLRLDFAANRVTEAVYVANQADEHGNKNEAKTAATINDLLSSYEKTYETRFTALNQQFIQGKKPSTADAKGARISAVNAYTELQLLRLQAPDAAQLAVLTAIDDTQQNIAALSDALGEVPLSASDFSQLAKLIPTGVVTRAEVDQLAGSKSSRQLHIQLKTMIENGALPSDLSDILNLDLVKQIAPTKVSFFEAVAQFEQMQRISAVVAAARPTATQKQAIQVFLANYTAGQAIPNNDIQQYITPIVYGVALSGQLQTNLASLSSIHMTPDDQALFDSWKGVLDPPNLTDTYQKFITGAENQPDLQLRTLTRTQQQLVNAQKAQVAYLVMPPGWGTGQMSTLNTEMEVGIAEATFQASKPDASQELARIATTQQQLQTALTNLNATYADNSTKLQTQINNFNGTPEQLAQLKSDLATLTQNQTTTVTNLQAQLTSITDAHTQLSTAIEKLSETQLKNLTELELRATANATQLTTATKTELTTSLNQIKQNSLTLTNNLQTRVDALDAGNTQVHTQLTSEIATIKSTYQQLAADVQSQLDAGVATSGQLQTTLTAVRADLTGKQTQLATLSSNATALTQLVNQVKTDAATQISNLQSQVDVIKLDQQTVKNSVDVLKTVAQDSQGLITGLQSRVDSLGTDQNQLREQLTGELQTIENNYTQLAAYTQAQLDAGVTTSTQLQTDLQTVQASLSQHASQLTSLSAGATALTQLVNQVKTDSTTQVGDLQSQINGLNIDQQTIKTSINALKDQQVNDVAQLTGQLAELNVVQTEAQATITALATEQTQAQSSINTLSTNFGVLQTAFTTSQQAQTAIQADIANQKSEIDSLQAQTQSAIDTLTQKQTQLTSQLDNLAANASTLAQTVTAVQSAGNTTKTQLDNLLATAPWAIPNGTYVTQTQLDSLSRQLTTEFAQKSAQLDTQFQTYKTQLDATVAQLSTQVQQLSTTTTNTATQQTQQQARIDTLTAQVQALQTQVQALVTATAPSGAGL